MKKTLMLICLGILISLTSYSQGFQFQPDVYVQTIGSAALSGRPNGYPDTLGLTYIQDKWSDMVANPSTYTNNYEFKNMMGYVKVAVNFDTGVITPPYSYLVNLRILKYSPASPTTPVGFSDVTLTLDYDSTRHAANRDLYIFKFNGTPAFKVVITSIVDANTSTTVTKSSLLKNFYIQSGISSQRYDKLSPFYIHTTSTSDGKYLDLQWWVNNSSGTSCSPPSTLPEFKPADYELEWTYVDNYKVTAPAGTISEKFTGSTGTIEYNFKNNATRIRLTGPVSSYKIPLVYEAGAIIYRLRAVRPGGPSDNYQGLVYSAWTLPDAGTLDPTQSCFEGAGYVIGTAHSNDLNWQYSINFAEDGKYKHVINYFDGTYRNRQTQTKINTDNDYIVAIDKIYDYEGRPAIETLPTPLLQNYLGFRTDISLTQTNKPYRPSLFDSLECSLPALLPVFNSSSKANIYYSSLNTDKSGVQKFVPDAQGYPFIQTTLSPDKSAKILWQGGAGLDHQLWTTHGTRFEYMRSSQPELNSMFGSQSWSWEYFTKRVSTDPNGQVSFDIMNYRGQPVASGLLGGVDTTTRPLHRLSNYDTGRYDCYDVLLGVRQDRLWNGWSVDIPFYNDKGGVHDVIYSVKVPAYTPASATGGTGCSSKKISAVGSYAFNINDDCGVPYLTSTTGSPTVNSDSSTYAYKIVASNLPKGKFAAQKTMTFSRSALYDKSRSFIIANEPLCYYNVNYFIRKAVEQADNEFPCIKAEELGPCEMRKRQMIRELYPGEKYGMYSKNDNGSFAEDTGSNSIFSVIFSDVGSTAGPDIRLRYQSPLCLSLPSVTKNGRTYTSLATLPVDTFIYIFNDQIAEALLPMHPEYCKLALCDDGTFAEQMEALETYKEASRLNKFSLDAIIKSDPLYYKAQPGDTAAMRTRLSYMKNFSSTRIDKLALEQAYCGAGNVEEVMHCKKFLYSTQIQNFTFIDSSVRQKYFDFLKGYYLSNRMLVLQRMLDSTEQNCTPCNGQGPTNFTLPYRMTVSGEKVFTTIFAPNSTDLDTSVHLPDWVESIINNANDPSYTATDTPPTDLSTFVSDNNQSVCDAQIEAIMARLQNCTTNGTTLAQIKTNLTSYCTSGAGGMTNLTPDQIKTAITTSTGLSLSDLCHPFLAEINVFADKENADAAYDCGADELYTGLKNLLGRTELINAMKNASIAGSTPASFNLTSGNKYENKIAAALSIATNASVNVFGQLDTIKMVGSSTVVLSYVKLKLYSGSDTVKLYIKQKQSSSADLYGAGTIVVNSASCINNDRLTNADGYIAQTNAVVDITVDGGSPGLYYLWSNSINLMQTPADGSLNGCLTCIDIKEAMKQFKADKATYSYDDALNHPLAENTIANYLNYKLNKSFTYADYLSLMEGCSVSDSVALPYHIGTLSGTFSSDAAANSFMSSWKSYTARDLVNSRVKYSSSNIKIVFNFADLPEDSLKIYMTACSTRIAGNSGTYAYLPDDVLSIFIPSSCTAPGSISNPGMFTSSSVDVMYNGSYGSYTLYTRTGTPGSPYSHANYWADARSFAQSCPATLVFYEGALLRSEDYGNATKRDLLAYIYGLNTKTKAEILDSLAPSNIINRISAFSGKGLSYVDPFCDGRMANLYVYDKVQSGYGGYQVMTKILDTVKASLGSRKIFPTTNKYSVSGTMKVYRKLNRTYWYRYFNPASNLLYNIHIETPKNTTDEAAATLLLDSVHVGQSSGNAYRFTAYMSYSGSSDPVVCRGYADFSIGTGDRWENVVLLDKQAKKRCIDSFDCEYFLLKDAKVRGQAWYDWNLDSSSNAMTDDMLAYFINNTVDTLKVCMEQQKFQMTLNYYDLVGNLEKTVPPAGVNTGGTGTHSKATTYEYNSQNQLVKKTTPDEGITNYFYDGANRLVFSQNSKQAPDGKYSYILYDKLSRVIETGEVALTTPGGSHPSYVTNSYYDIYPHDTIEKYVRTKTRYDVVLTTYDTAIIDLGAISGQHLSSQENLRNKVSAIYFYPSQSAYYPPAAPLQPQFATFYSYDLLGNVKTVSYIYHTLSSVRQNYKRVDYDYDQVSGKVNMLTYNRSLRDQYYQRYEYDADNRLTTMYTSSDGLVWNKEARYEYYKHGPLATAKIGDMKIQCIDYAYTIQGWLKAINSDVRKADKDMGQNGVTNDLSYAQDALAHSLHYFDGDYAPIGSQAVTHLTDPSLKLYNGNIVRQTTSSADMGGLRRDYRYDQLHRLVKATYGVVDEDNLTVSSSVANMYRSTYTYDPDGNIQKLRRYDESGAILDSLNYMYKAGTNRLHRVQEVAAKTAYDMAPSQADSNYKYDNTGNLVRDKQEKLKMVWNAYGKLASITDTATNVTIYYEYDGNGNRYRKDVVTPIDADNATHQGTYYVRDASGNILAVYSQSTRESPIEIIQEVNNELQQGGQLVTVIKKEFIPNGEFIEILTTGAATEDPGWSTMTTNKPIGFFFGATPSLYNDLLYSDNTYLIPLFEYDRDNGTEIFSTGYYDRADIAATMVSAVLADTNAGKKLLQHFETNMPATDVADLYSHYGVTYTQGQLTDNADAMTAYMKANSAQAVVRASMMNVVTTAASEAEAKAFYNDVVHDDEIYHKPTLMGATSNFGKANADILYIVADRPTVYTFFDGWGGSPGWLNANTTLKDRLAMVINDDPETVLTDLLGTPSADIINTAIAGITGMTGARYVNLILTNPNLGLDPNSTTVIRNYAVGVTADTMTLDEHHFYGINRVGVQRYDHYQMRYRNTYNADGGVTQLVGLDSKWPWYSYGQGELIKKTEKTPYGNGDTAVYSLYRIIGLKHLELTDHLGNVLVTVRDRKTGHKPSGSPTSYDYWTPDVYSSQDYYPFGMQMPSRHLYAYPNYYRFGYNGQMKEEHLTADGQHGIHNTAMFWEYDTRLARRWNVDPVVKTWESSYATFANNPILYCDPLGLDKNKPISNPEHGDVDANTGSVYDKDLGWVMPEASISSSSNSPSAIRKGFTGTGATAALLWRDGYLRTEYYNKLVNEFKNLHKAGSISDGTYSMLRYHAQKATRMQLSQMGQYISEYSKSLGKPIAAQKALAEAVASGQVPLPVRAMGTRGSTTAVATALKVGGQTVLVASAVMSVHHVVTAENKGLAASQEIGGWAGSYAGAEAGAAAGGAIGVWGGGVGAVPGAIAGGVIGGIIGYFAGYEAGETIYQSATNEN